MKLEEAINHYLELKPCENWIESIDTKFFFEFAETLLYYIKEESIPRAVMEEKIKELEEIRRENVNTRFVLEYSMYNAITNEIDDLQEILNKGE